MAAVSGSSSALYEKSSNISPSVGTKSEGAAAPVSKPVSPNDFEVGKILGKGKYGTVYRVRYKPTKYTLVLKTVLKREILEDGVKHQLQREVEIHSRCRHPNIVRFKCFLYDKDRLYMVLEYCNKGNLYEMMQKQADKRLSEDTARNVLAQLVSALQYLRESKRVPIIHRDIKPENVMVCYDKATKKRTYKLGDFGWAVYHVPSSVRETLCGTPEYLPPEVAQSERYSGGFDIWTLGILLYEMLVGKTPFSSDSDRESQHTVEAVADRIVLGKFEVPKCVPSGAADLIRSMLRLDPAKRISLRGIREHPWLRGAEGLEGAGPATAAAAGQSGGAGTGIGAALGGSGAPAATGPAPASAPARGGAEGADKGPGEQKADSSTAGPEAGAAAGSAGEGAVVEGGSSS